MAAIPLRFSFVSHKKIILVDYNTYEAVLKSNTIKALCQPNSIKKKKTRETTVTDITGT